MPDYEGMILAAQDAREIAEDEPDYDPALTCWCCPEDYNYENCENCDYRFGRSLSMNKDLYIEFLESEIRRIRAGANTHYGQSIGWMDELQDLKLENDRLAKRDYKMRQVIRSIACEPDCEFCLLRGSECSGSDMQHLASQTLKELEEL